MDKTISVADREKELIRIMHTEASWGWGGQEIRVLRECELLGSVGHEVILCSDPRSLIAQRASSFNVTHVPCRLSKKRLSDLLSIGRVLRDIRPHVVACHSSTDHWLIAVARFIFRHSFAVLRFRHISTPVKTTAMNRWLYTRGADMVVTTGDYITGQLVNSRIARQNRIVSIPTGVDPSRFTVKDVKEAKSALRLATYEFTVCIVATLRSWKGHAHLIRAVERMPRGEVKLLIVGDGPQRVYLENLSRDLGLVTNVIFYGHQTNVLPYLQAADVFALPSYANEGVPQAILQSMALGLPIITCPVGGIPESVRDYANCRLIPPRNIESIVSAISDYRLKWARGDVMSVSPWIPYTETEMLRQCLAAYNSAINFSISSRSRASSNGEYNEDSNI